MTSIFENTNLPQFVKEVAGMKYLISFVELNEIPSFQENKARKKSKDLDVKIDYDNFVRSNSLK